MNSKTKRLTIAISVIATALLLTVVYKATHRAPATRAESTENQNIPTYKIELTQNSAMSSFDGVVESARQTTLATQVSGNVVEIRAKAGDHVNAGQVLLRIDSRAADQGAVAGAAQATAAQAALQVASKELERQQLLFSKQYISQAALEQAQLQYQSAKAAAQATLAQSRAVEMQAGFYVVKAPFAGVVSDISAKLGDMAMPGAPLGFIYDPNSMRISAQIPQSQVALAHGESKIELPYMKSAAEWLSPARVDVLPAIDAKTHSATARFPINMDSNTAIVPGTFARVWVQTAADSSSGQTAQNISVPIAAVLRRGEMDVVYVRSTEGKFLMRQVRTGQTQGENIQILTGLNAGEEIATTPQNIIQSQNPLNQDNK